MPCDDERFLPDAAEGASFGCNLTSPCGHKTANFTAQLGPICEAGVTEPRYCAAPHLGGMVGEGVGCGLTLRCAAGQAIKAITFADWGLPYADGADPLEPGAGCGFVSNLRRMRAARSAPRWLRAVFLCLIVYALLFHHTTFHTVIRQSKIVYLR